MRTTSLQEACATIPDGASLMIGGSIGVGNPGRLGACRALVIPGRIETMAL
jgi:acyl CoA:acetate/3-ketoacid CoA transferase alpha subunit